MRQKNEMVAALWSNSNWDDNKGTRKNAISDIEQSCSEAIEIVELAISPKPIPQDEMLTDDNPFFAAAERGLSRIDAKAKGVTTQQPKQEDIEYMRGLDQAPD